MSWNRDTVHAWLKFLVPVGLLITAMIFWGQAIIGVVAPFVLAFLVAYIFRPVISVLEGGRQGKKRRIPRTVAVLLVYLGFLLMLAFAGYILTVVAGELALLAKQLPDYFTKVYLLLESFLRDQLDKVPAEVRAEIKNQLSRENLEKLFFEYVQPTFENADIQGGAAGAMKGVSGFVVGFFGLVLSGLGRIAGSAGSFLGMTLSAVLTLVVAFYLMLDFEKFLDRTGHLIPKEYEERSLRIFKRIDSQISGFLRGQLTVCIIVGVLVTLAMSLLGVKYAVLIGVAAGVFNVIPYLGPVMGGIPAVVITMLDTYQPEAESGANLGPMVLRVGLVVVVFTAIQTLDGMVISPKILGDQLDLHPMVILFALLLGGALFGLFGMLAAVPVACVVRVLIEEIYFHDPSRPIA